MYADGYKYWLAYKTNTTSYYRCCRYISSKCPGRCVDENGKVRSTTAHNHPAEPDRALVDKFRKILTQRAASEKTELYAIYCDEATSRHSDAAMLYPFASARSAMRKARRKQLPQTPNTVTDIVDVLDTSDLFRVNSGPDKDSIYQKTIKLEDSICMIFMHSKTVELFGRIDEIHLDGTVEFHPDSLSHYHLITVHAVQGYITAPIVYFIVTAKTQSTYAALFAYIREDLNISPNMIMSDFDPTMQISLAYAFPESVVKGCWFHYTDAVLAQTRALNLQKETYKGVGASALRMLLVLPLLPAEYMSPGLESIKKWMKEKNIFSMDMSNLCSYIEYSWLRSTGAEKMSIFGTQRGIMNHLKNFNRELSTVIGTESPTIWVILESITQLATKTYVKINKKIRLVRNETAGKSATSPSQAGTKARRKSDLFTETIISNATQLWIKTPVHLRNPLQFLQLSSHCINDSISLGNLSDIRHCSTSACTCFSPSISAAQRQIAKCHEEHLETTEMILQNDLNTIILPSNSIALTQYPITNGVILSENEDNVGRESSSSLHCIPCPQNYTNNKVSISSPAPQTSCANQLLPIRTETRQPVSSDPPPLAFFPTVKRIAHKRRLPILSEPPPLVPINFEQYKKVENKL